MVTTIAYAVLGIVLGVLISLYRQRRRRPSIEFHEGQIRSLMEVKNKSRWIIHLWSATSPEKPRQVYIGWQESVADLEGDTHEMLLIYPFSIADANDLANLLELAADGTARNSA